MTTPKRVALTTAILALQVASSDVTPVDAQTNSRGERRDRHPGSAIVRPVADGEALIRIECDVAGQPEAGFTTEANRRTREATGRSNMGAVRLRPWQDTDDVLITTSAGIAWVPRPTSSGGVLAMEVEVGPPGFEQNGQPVLVTYDMWKAGEGPTERTTIYFEANCVTRDPAAPAWKKLDGLP